MSYQEEIHINDSMILSEVLSTLPYYVFWKDRNLVFQGCNILFAQQFNYKTTQEVIGKTDNNFPWPENLRKKYRDDDLKVILTGESLLNISEEQKQSDGSIKTLLVSKVPVRNSQSHIIGILGAYTDITYLKNIENSLRRAKENAEAANRAKAEFIANMSHDVKSPMAGIVMFSQLMESNPKWLTSETAGKIHASAAQVLKFFDSCLELSKMEMSEFESKQVIFSLPDLLKEIYALFVPRAQGKGLSLHIDYDLHLHQAFLGCRGSIYRVMLNLVGNAVKFTEKGSVTVRAFIADHLSDNKIRVGLEIKDTGIGIPEDKYQIIFEKLRRLTPSYEGNIEGSGIGLYIVDQYVEHMQGEIKVASTVGQGSTFTVLLPLEVASESHLPAEPRVPANASTPVALANIKTVAQFAPAPQKTLSVDAPLLLLVEDNIMIQIATQGLLNGAGFQVDIAGSGAEALEAFVPGKYAFIYMDIGLPDIQGYEVAAAIRQKEKDLNVTVAIPIIALTAHGATDIKAFCGNSGMQGVLTKPLTPEQAQAVWQRYGKGESSDVPGLTLLEISPVPDTHISSEKSAHTIPVIDLAATVEFVGSEAQAKEIYQLLVNELTQKYLPQLGNAVKQQDYTELRKHLHSLIGGLSYAKAPRLYHAVLELQVAARNASPTITTAYEHVKAEAEQFFVHYQQLKK